MIYFTIILFFKFDINLLSSHIPKNIVQTQSRMLLLSGERFQNLCHVKINLTTEEKYSSSFCQNYLTTIISVFTTVLVKLYRFRSKYSFSSKSQKWFIHCYNPNNTFSSPFNISSFTVDSKSNLSITYVFHFRKCDVESILPLTDIDTTVLRKQNARSHHGE